MHRRASREKGAASTCMTIAKKKRDSQMGAVCAAVACVYWTVVGLRIFLALCLRRLCLQDREKSTHRLGLGLGLGLRFKNAFNLSLLKLTQTKRNAVTG